MDRAVLHFLLSEAQITRYFANFKAAVKPGGHVLLAEFAKTGARKCAGLEIHQYCAQELAQRLGNDFELLETQQYVFTTPSGLERPYVYAFLSGDFMTPSLRCFG